MTDDDDEAVGFGRPPRKSQFGQPGGNLRGPGRKRGSRNVSTVFAEVAGSKVIAKDGQGKRRSISKFEAALTQLLNQAASGDLRAIRMMITLAEGIEAKSEQTNLPEITLTEADRPPARPHQLVEFLPGEDLRHQPSLAGALFDVDMPSR